VDEYGCVISCCLLRINLGFVFLQEREQEQKQEAGVPKDLSLYF
jgi:hypothetical protein